MPSGGTRLLSDLLFCTRKSVALPLTMLACFLSLAALDRLVLESAVLSEKKARVLMLGKVCPEHRKVHDCLFFRICHTRAPPGKFLVHLESCPDLLRGLGTGASW